jgi:hypothetical protein
MSQSLAASATTTEYVPVETSGGEILPFPSPADSSSPGDTGRAPEAPPHQSYTTAQALAEFERWSRSYDRSFLQYLLFEPTHRLLLAQLAPRCAATSGHRLRYREIPRPGGRVFSRNRDFRAGFISGHAGTRQTSLPALRRPCATGTRRQCMPALPGQFFRRGNLQPQLPPLSRSATGDLRNLPGVTRQWTHAAGRWRPRWLVGLVHLRHLRHLAGRRRTPLLRQTLSSAVPVGRVSTTATNSPGPISSFPGHRCHRHQDRPGTRHAGKSCRVKKTRRQTCSHEPRPWAVTRNACPKQQRYFPCRSWASRSKSTTS